MKKKIGDILTGIYYFMPVQLLIYQVRQHKIFLGVWLLLFLALLDGLGEMFGVPYLFLEPEYRGEVNFASLFLLGVGTGSFISAFNIATYISDGYHFNFIALERRPFRAFALNNCLLPVSYVLIFCIRYIVNGYENQERLAGALVSEVFAYLSGTLLVLLLIMAYFTRTNKNVNKFFGEDFVKDLKSRRTIIGKAKRAASHQTRVDSYISPQLRIEETHHSQHAEFRDLIKVLNQNHGTALFLEFIFIVTVMGMGLLENVSWFQVPAGMSILLFFSILLMLIAAFNFWFRKLGPILLLLMVILYFVLDQPSFFRNRHQAPGMDYAASPADYSMKNLQALTATEQFHQDTAYMRKILDNWLVNFQRTHAPGVKARPVFLCTSGGGQRSSYFTFRAIQMLDKITDGEFFDNTRLISGASGGMVGAAYYRELSLRMRNSELPQGASWNDSTYNQNVSSDLLNRIGIKIVSGLFLPSLRVTVGDQKYISDRGVSLDQQLMTNLPELDNVRLSDYTEPERQALIPVMILSPVIINDGRKLHICSSPVSFLCSHSHSDGDYRKGVNGVEFRRFFRNQDADSLLFVTALRMNASFPIITPYVQLPSDPAMKVMDAGVADNFGVQTAGNFLFIFREWFKKNTDGVLVLQIRDSRQQGMELPRRSQDNLLNQFLDPIGSTYSAIIDSRDHLNEDVLEYADQWLGNKFHYIRLEYAPKDSSTHPASLNWHLTSKEISDIERALYENENYSAMQEVAEFLKPVVHQENECE